MTAETNARRALAFADGLQEGFEKQQVARQELTDLLVERLGSDIGRAIKLLKEAGPYFQLEKELKDARKQANAQKKVANAAKRST